MHGLAKYAPFGDPLRTGHHLEALGSRTLNNRQANGVVVSGWADADNHDG
jgi:hypothetical protein